MSWISDLQNKIDNKSKIQKVIGQLAVRSIQRNFDACGRPERWQGSIRAKMKGGKTLTLSAKLRNSIVAKVQGDIIRIGSNLRYAKIHQEGGVITPKSAKMLAIPLTAIAKVQEPKDFDNLFVYKSANNKVFLAQSKDKKLVCHYLLKRKVVIPARPFLVIPEEDKESYITAIRGHFF